MDHRCSLRNLLTAVRYDSEAVRMRVGAFIIDEGVDHWKLAQEFLDKEGRDKFDLPTEKRIILYRETYIELHINPLPLPNKAP